MNVEDRIRAATRARTDLVRDIGPLELPADQPHRSGVRPRLRFPAPVWAPPAAAAAVIVALAVVLVTARQARNEPLVPAPAPTVSSPAVAAEAAAVPEYYAAIIASSASLVVGSARTGKPLATVSPPAGAAFAGVTAAADDRTFVLDTQDHQGTHAWYQLRVAPGSPRPAQLARLPIATLPGSDQVDGLALSPDGSTLAVFYQPDVPSAAPGAFTLRTYALASGQPLRAWSTPADNQGWSVSTVNSDNRVGLTWTADGRTLAFVFPPDTWPDYERTLSVAGQGTDLLAGSRPVLAIPGDQHGCASVLLAADGSTVVCGTLANASGGCAQIEPEFTRYSVASGKRAGTLYRYRGACTFGVGYLLWAGSGTRAIGVVAAIHDTGHGTTAKTTVDYTVGLATPGRFTRLRVQLPSAGSYLPGTIAF